MKTESLPPYPLRRHLNAANLSFVLFAVLVITSLPALESSGRDIKPLQQLIRFGTLFFPPDLSILPDVIAALWETIQMAALATLFGLGFSLCLGFTGARTLAPKWLVIAIRAVLNAIRTIPSLIWAVLAVAMLGANTLAGVVGLTLYSIGYLGKFFSEAFESLDMDLVTALRDLGAKRIQAFQYGLWPNVRPIIWSHTLWMFEYNIRSASIIGYVGAGGIGLQLLRYQEFGQWDRFATVLICIFIIVIALDSLSAKVRNALTPKERT